MTDDRHDLELLLASRIPIIAIETREERRAETLVRDIALARFRAVFSWSAADGLRRLDFDAPPQSRLTDPTALLRHIKADSAGSLFILPDFHPYLDTPINVRLLKEIALDHEQGGHTVVLISHALQLPGELAGHAAVTHLALPGGERLEAIVREVARDWVRERREPVKTDEATFQLLVRHLGGVTEADARRLARGAIFDDGAITGDDVAEVARAKYALLEHDGALHFEYDTARFADVGGFERLKRWLAQREAVFLGQDRLPGLDPPKGVLLVGVQGAGKSLAAKAVAGLWGVPLLGLDMGALYNKFFGESERNVRQALKAAEAMAPCVLWIDEIEKGIATGENDGGTSRRILGTLLTWMAERKAPVFLVATANAIEQLPPELVRKGRFDEIFFVDLPSQTTRAAIFAIHLNKRALDPAGFDLDRLATASEGFSGAEIEQAVVAALYSARAGGGTPNTAHVIAEIEQTRPLSVVMAERMTLLRSWAEGRTVSVD
jgi:AAA+ superfamily predicted ATPase